MGLQVLLCLSCLNSVLPAHLGSRAAPHTGRTLAWSHGSQRAAGPSSSTVLQSLTHSLYALSRVSSLVSLKMSVK